MLLAWGVFTPSAFIVVHYGGGPLGAMVWVTTVLLDHSLRLSSTDQISQLSRSLERTGREYYQQACEQLKADAQAGRVAASPAA